ncbi:MAG TPA: Holliday junction resolvase RuvX [Candidatus Paceibacterota bacterium]|nr:Holliday junction resolvase RuvX [Candidatus Paceibacterota bacterium]
MTSPKTLGIDYGTRKIGLALSDDGGTFAFPYGVIPRIGGEAHIARLVKDLEVGVLVMGKSTNLSGGDNTIVEEAKLFADAVSSQTSIKVVFIDERFSSMQANQDPGQKKARPQTRTRNTERSIDDDAHAAAIVLQSYLDMQKGR